MPIDQLFFPEHVDATTMNQILQNLYSALSQGVPVGEVRMFAGSTAPAGWLLCQGQSLKTAAYPQLFGAIGYNFGGSGANFNLPDLRGRTPIGAGTGSGLTTRSLGAVGGEENHVLGVGEMPSHTHDIRDSAGFPYDGVGINVTSGPIGYAQRSASVSLLAQPTGGGGGHNNMQPFQAVNFIIKY